MHTPHAIFVHPQGYHFTSTVDKKSVFFDIYVDNHFEGRMIIILFRPTGAKTSAFLDTCTNTHGNTYKGLTLCAATASVDETSVRVMEVWI